MKFFKRNKPEVTDEQVPASVAAPSAEQSLEVTHNTEPKQQRASAKAPDVTPTPAAPAEPEKDGKGFFSRLRKGLGRTSDNLVAGLAPCFLGAKRSTKICWRSWSLAC